MNETQAAVADSLKDKVQQMVNAAFMQHVEDGRPGEIIISGEYVDTCVRDDALIFSVDDHAKYKLLVVDSSDQEALVANSFRDEVQRMANIVFTTEIQLPEGLTASMPIADYDDRNRRYDNVGMRDHVEGDTLFLSIKDTKYKLLVVNI